VPVVGAVAGDEFAVSRVMVPDPMIMLGQARPPISTTAEDVLSPSAAGETATAGGDPNPVPMRPMTMSVASRMDISPER